MRRLVGGSFFLRNALGCRLQPGFRLLQAGSSLLHCSCSLCDLLPGSVFGLPCLLEFGSELQIFLPLTCHTFLIVQRLNELCVLPLLLGAVAPPAVPA